jgi:hypothetical protein
MVRGLASIVVGRRDRRLVGHVIPSTWMPLAAVMAPPCDALPDLFT